MKRQPSQEDKEIGERIKQMRADLDISGIVLADKLGVSRGAVGNWERGQGIKRENLQRIAKAYKISYEWLATGRGDMRSPPEPRDSLDRMLDEVPDEFADEVDLIREDVKRQIRLLERASRPR